MLAYFLILGSAYLIAFKVAISKPGFGRAAVGFIAAVAAAWLLGSSLVAQGAAFLEGLLGRQSAGHSDAKQVTLYLLQRGLWWALIGATLGVFWAKYKTRRQRKASSTEADSWRGKIALTTLFLGALSIVAMQAYKGYTKPSVKPSGQYQTQRPLAPEPRVSDEKIRYTPNAATPANSQSEKTPGRTIDQTTATSNEDWEHGDIVIPQGSTESSSATGTSTEEHFRRIHAIHPDADAIFSSAGFNAWVASYPAYQRIARQGTTQEVIEMFTAYKNQRRHNPFDDPYYGK